ncbi:3-beta hydroxysteroid dehydrogenase [Rhizobium sp. Root1203]|uniref:SDR family oxidoreductase n=1 Tax=Rhizobium sp. Root1203 TaxID=1736427 RepID=UPI000710BB48|nr:SDR family oxidoreductase [Rhizobium sp. Root1203]KQV25382.1 3-beta hydroxysteroid dehydrogenase [Rhizobium sp. Root1203]
MHVFVTGATGWVGSAVVDDLLAAGHTVTGLARNGDKAEALAQTGTDVVIGTLDDHDALKAAAQAADAVVHTAFHHDFSRFLESAAQDQRAIEAMGAVLEGTDKPIIVTTGLSGLPRGASEDDRPNPTAPRRSEAAARTLIERGVRAGIVRLAPSVYGIGDYGFVPMVAGFARRTGVSAWIGDGRNCWSGVHRLDAARIYRLALEQGLPDTVYHAVADEPVPFRQIAEVVARQLGLPAASRPAEHFGGFASMVGADMAASSARTRALLGWTPTGPGLLTDIDQPGYYPS